MKLVVEMPWEKDLSVNAYRFGRPPPGQKFRRRKPHVQAWMDRLAGEIRWRYPLDLGRFGCWTYDGEKVLPSNKYYIHRPKDVRILVNFRFPDKRRRDAHNYFKVICDAVAAGLGIDDKDIRISTRTVMVDKQNPSFTIEVSDETAASQA